MDKNLKLYTYPEGKENLQGEEIVNVLSSYGSFTDAYEWELSNGDVYCRRVKKELPPRNKEEILQYIIDKKLTCEWVVDVDGEYVSIEVWNASTMLVNYPLDEDCTSSFMEAVNYVMDQDETEL